MMFRPALSVKGSWIAARLVLKPNHPKSRLTIERAAKLGFELAHFLWADFMSMTPYSFW